MKTILITTIFLFFSGLCYAADRVAVIVHPENKNILTHDQINHIYLKRTGHFPDGLPCHPIAKKRKSWEAQLFNLKILHKTPSQYRSYWSKLSFTGRGKAPKEYRTDHEVLNIVAKNPLAIGYVSESSLNNSVRVLFYINSN